MYLANLCVLLCSGERVDLKNWPKSLELKGRVRLAHLDKFLQDLQQSRSRAVTVQPQAFVTILMLISCSCRTYWTIYKQWFHIHFFCKFQTCLFSSHSLTIYAKEAWKSRYANKYE